MSSQFSEAPGFFQSDNFTSNELGFPEIVTRLVANATRGGAYLGVGPEQNFHYIAAIRPQIAFLVDIRRQAVMQHLMYKAIVEIAFDRVEFISILFCKPPPPGLRPASGISTIWSAYRNVATDTSLYTRNVNRIRQHLVITHGFPISAEDLNALDYVYSAFVRLGPSISTSGYGATRVPSATFETLTKAMDSTMTARSFLATESDFQFLKTMHSKNLIVPVVADFAGPSGIRFVAQYLREIGTPVTAFYVSNVEPYLFSRPGEADAFYANVSALPITPSTVFIRLPNVPSPLCPVQGFLAAHAVGRVRTYRDAFACVSVGGRFTPGDRHWNGKLG
jgi:hypothetical protein